MTSYICPNYPYLYKKKLKPYTRPAPNGVCTEFQRRGPLSLLPNGGSP